MAVLVLAVLLVSFLSISTINVAQSLAVGHKNALAEPQANLEKRGTLSPSV
jgi:hypothetical protein